MTAALKFKVHRGAPGFAESQRDEILGLLQEAGPNGVSRAFLIFEKQFTQCGTRIFELQKMGYIIRSELREGDRCVTYVLQREPREPKPLPTSQNRQYLLSDDWYERQTGKPRPSGEPQDKSEDLPLFEFEKVR